MLRIKTLNGAANTFSDLNSDDINMYFAYV